MKSLLIILILFALLTGCTTGQADPTTTTTTPTVPTTTTENTQLSVTEKDPTVPLETVPATPSETVPATPAESPTNTVIYTLYIPNDDAETFTEVTIETNQISAEHVLAALQKYDVLPENVALNAFGSSGTQLTMDFNRPFGDLISSTGTSGERMITGSVFNTFLNAFQAESIVFTVEGEILESGHVIYDFPIGYIE